MHPWQVVNLAGTVQQAGSCSGGEPALTAGWELGRVGVEQQAGRSREEELAPRQVGRHGRLRQARRRSRHPCRLGAAADGLGEGRLRQAGRRSRHPCRLGAAEERSQAPTAGWGLGRQVTVQPAGSCRGGAPGTHGMLGTWQVRGQAAGRELRRRWAGRQAGGEPW